LVVLIAAAALLVCSSIRQTPLEPNDIPAGGPPVLAWPMDLAANERLHFAGGRFQALRAADNSVTKKLHQTSFLKARVLLLYNCPNSSTQLDTEVSADA
jgi:hypothetical protein